MATDEHRPDPHYDDREIDVRTIVRLTVGLAAVVIATVGIAWVVTRDLTDAERATHPPPPPIAAGASTTPIEPRLQPSPPIDLGTLRAEESKALTTYRWVDRNAGVVGIPIERAIDLVAQRGLPARTDAAPASTVTMPTRSSLGDLAKEAKP